MLEEYKELHGLTLEEVAERTGPHLHGYAVFLLPVERPDDMLGDPVAESVSVAEFLKIHPQASGWVVKYTNDYYGMIVLRAVNPAED